MKVKDTILACALTAAITLVPLAGCASQGAGTSSADEASGSSEASTSVAEADADATPKDTQYILYLGTNDKDTNQPVYSREESKERAKAILMDNLGGYTIQEAEGGWRDDNGTEYQEYTLVIYLSDTDIDTVHDTARKLIEEFNQSSVLISTELVGTEFFSGD